MLLDSEQLLLRFREMGERLIAIEHLRRLGRLFDATVLIEVDGAEIYLTFERGSITRVVREMGRKIPWQFAFRVRAEALQGFWEPLPAPGYHDIFGLVKLGVARIDGDILLLVKNLRFFKEFLALGRTAS
jgi:hypothetical protein